MISSSPPVKEGSLGSSCSLRVGVVGRGRDPMKLPHGRPPQSSSPTRRTGARSRRPTRRLLLPSSSTPRHSPTTASTPRPPASRHLLSASTSLPSLPEARSPQGTSLGAMGRSGRSRPRNACPRPGPRPRSAVHPLRATIRTPLKTVTKYRSPPRATRSTRLPARRRARAHYRPFRELPRTAFSHSRRRAIAGYGGG